MHHAEKMNYQHCINAIQQYSFLKLPLLPQGWAEGSMQSSDSAFSLYLLPWTLSPPLLFQICFWSSQLPTLLLTSFPPVSALPCLFLSYDLASVQFSSVAQSCPTLCDPMNCSTPGLPVHHQLPDSTQTHVHRVGDTIQPSHPRSSPSPPAPSPSQHQSLFQ